MTLEYVLSILQIILIDIVLSGDNAVVIAMAAHKLPPHQRKRAILWGGGIAIFMRVVFTIIVAGLLMVPVLKLVGGFVLAIIACKLLLEEDEPEITPENAQKSAWAAIRMIFVADFVMSLDNMLAVAGAAHGDNKALIFGLLVSIAIIMTCSGLIASLMNRYHWIVYLGAMILAFTAAQMMVEDREVARFFVRGQHVSLSSHWEEAWMTSHAKLKTYSPPAELPPDLRDVVQYRAGKLTFIGQMTANQHDELLSYVAEEEDKDGNVNKEGKHDREHLREMYETAREVAVPGWVPDGLKPRIAVFIQHKWPATDWQNVQGRQYHFVAYIVYAIVIGICVASPKWWPGRKEAPPEKPAEAPVG